MVDEHAGTEDESEHDLRVEIKRLRRELDERTRTLTRRATEVDELRVRAESKYEELYESSPDMYVSVSAETAQVTVCNQTAAAKLGRDKSWIIGRSIFELYHPDCLSAVEEAFQQFVTHGEVNNAELALLRADGSKLPVLLSVRAIRGADGRADHSISTWRDISSLKRMERLESLTRQLEASNAELEQFAYVVSHDLQEPLRMVTSFSKHLADDMSASKPENVDKYLGFIVDGATRMQTLVQDLLGYSRVGRDEQPTEIDASTVFENVCEDMQVTIEGANATVTADALPLLVFDATLLRQLFQNLIGNALKFCSDTPAQVRVSANRELDGWRFSVRDNGIGIRAKYQRQIFLMFQRLHNREEYEGSGVGLAICQKIVARHGGRIWVESALGQGATFHFTIPDDSGEVLASMPKRSAS